MKVWRVCSVAVRSVLKTGDNTLNKCTSMTHSRHFGKYKKVSPSLKRYIQASKTQIAMKERTKIDAEQKKASKNLFDSFMESTMMSNEMGNGQENENNHDEELNDDDDYQIEQHTSNVDISAILSRNNNDPIINDDHSETKSPIRMFEPNRQRKVVSPPNSRFLRIAIIGRPNSGKSALLNRLVNYRVSATSSKVNTTRSETKGILTLNHVQMEFADTPGILPLSPDLVEYQKTRENPLECDLFDYYRGSSTGANLNLGNRKLEEQFLHLNAWHSVHSADVVLFVVDPSRKYHEKDFAIARQLSALDDLFEKPTDQDESSEDTIIPSIDPTRKIPKLRSDNDSINPNHRRLYKVLLINKCDLIWPHDSMHELIDTIQREHCHFDLALLVSAKKHRRIAKLKSLLYSLGSVEAVPHLARQFSKPWKYDSGVRTLMSREQEIAEVIRGKIFQRLHKEVPYVTEVSIESYKESQDSIDLSCVLSVDRPSQVRIVGASTMAHLRRWIQQDLQKKYGKLVFIECRVRLK